MDPPPSYLRWPCTNGYLDLQKGVFIKVLPPDVTVTCNYDYQEYTIDSPEVSDMLPLLEKLCTYPFKKLWDVLAISLERGPMKICLNTLSNPMFFNGPGEAGKSIYETVLQNLIMHNPSNLLINGEESSVILWLAFRRYKILKAKPRLMTYLALEEGCSVTILETIDHFL